MKSYPYNIKMYNPDTNDYKTAHVYATSLTAAFKRAENQNSGYLAQQSV